MAKIFTPGCLLALGLTLAGVSVPVAAQDDATARAKVLFQQGVADFEAGRYEIALEAFQEAHRLKPHPMVQVNMANCYDKLGRPLEAIFHFEQVLKSGAADAKQKQDIAKAVRRLMKHVADITFDIAPDGAVVVIDGGEQRRAPILEPVRLVAGTHRVVAHLEGYQSADTTFEVRGGKPGEVHLTLEREQAVVLAAPPVVAEPAEATPAAAPEEVATPPAASVVDASAVVPAEPAPAPAEPSSAPTIPTHVWAAGGVTVALILAASISGLIANGAEADFQDSRRRYLGLKDNPTVSGHAKVQSFDIAVEDADRAETLAVTTDVLLGAALVSAGVTAYLYLASRADSSERARLRLAPTAGRHEAGLALTGAF